TLTVYFGSVGIKNIRHTLVAALAADCAGVIASVWICSLIFG
ncbi:MAG: spore maturation protein, partial [Clostridiaceae bacterium]|nr:spore maturation protein [Clostridiaceae bacterium]